MKVLRPRVGYTDLMQAPEDGRRYELYDGEVFVVPSPLPIHQLVADNLYVLLRSHALATGGLAITAPLDIVFSEHDVLQPDVVFFTAGRRHLVRLEEPIRHPPDLVVEVLSPSTAATDRGKKMQMFGRYRVPEYWIVDPAARTVEVHAHAGDAYRLVQTAAGADLVRSPLLPGLEVPAGRVFPAHA